MGREVTDVKSILCTIKHEDSTGSSGHLDLVVFNVPNGTLGFFCCIIVLTVVTQRFF